MGNSKKALFLYVFIITIHEFVRPMNRITEFDGEMKMLYQGKRRDGLDNWQWKMQRDVLCGTLL